LTENYRSSRAVVRAANSLRPGAQQESEFALEGVAQATSFDSEEEEAKWIISSVQSLLETQTHPEIEGEISLANMVVIARNRFVFTKLQEALSESNIDYNLKIGEREKLPISLFGQVLDLAIRLKLNPSDWVDGEKLCQLIGISPPNEWGDEALLKQFHSAVVATGRPQSGLIANLITKIDELESENPNILKFEKLFEKQIRGFAALENNETRNLEFDRSLVELREFSDRWTKFRQLGLGSTLNAFRNAMALGKLNPDSSETGLTLSTVHTMKGLEKDIVFLMGFCEGTFPDYRATTEKAIDQERNTAFVAITRARRWLFVTFPRTRMMPWNSLKSQYASRFISEMSL